MFGAFGLAEIDLAHFQQGEIALAVLGRANLAGDGVAGAQVEATDLAGGDIDVVRAGQVGGIGRPQEAEAVLQDFQHAVTVDVLATLGMALEDRKDNVLLARTGHALQAHILGDVDEFLGRFGFQIGKIHRLSMCSWSGRKDLTRTQA